MSIPAGAVWTLSPDGDEDNGAGFVSGYSTTELAGTAHVSTDAYASQSSTTINLNSAVPLTSIAGQIGRIVSGTNATVGYYLATAHTAGTPTVTLDRAPCSSGAGSDIHIRFGGAGGETQAGIERVLSAAVDGNRIELEGGTYDKTGGGSLTVAAGSIVVEPNDGVLTAAAGAVTDLVLTVVDDDGEPIDLSAATLDFAVTGLNLPNTLKFRLTSASGLTVSGSGGNVVTASLSASHVATPGTWRYDLWRTDGDDTRLASGVFTVTAAGAVAS